MYALLTKWEVKMTWYWQSSFPYISMYQDEVNVHKKAKREQG